MELFPGSENNHPETGGQWGIGGGAGVDPAIGQLAGQNGDAEAGAPPALLQGLAHQGRVRRELGLGSVRLVSLAEAREKALASRKLAREGGDPLAEKRRAEGMPSFSEAAARVLEQKRAGWRSRSHAQSWLSGLQRYAFPRIGKMPVPEVSSADVLEILAPVWHVKPDMAGKLRQHMRAVLEWAGCLTGPAG